MVGIFALLNGEPRSDFSMRCYDLLHNHSCQLAHYGFCPKPLSDVRRALFSLGCLMKESSLSLPLSTLGGKTKLMLAWREPLADFVIVVVNKDLTPPPSIQEYHFLFGCSENIETQYERSEYLSRSTFGRMTEDRG